MPRFNRSMFVDVYETGCGVFELNDPETVKAISDFVFKHQDEFDQECFAEEDPYCVGSKPDDHEIKSRAVIYYQDRLIKAWEGEIDERYFIFHFDGEDYQVHKGFFEIVLESSKHWLIDLIRDHYDDFDCFCIVECPTCKRWAIAV